MMKFHFEMWFVPSVLLLLSGCWGRLNLNPPDTDTPSDTDSLTDTGSGSDTDTPSDTDTQTDADSDTASDTVTDTMDDACHSGWGALDSNTSLCWQNPESVEQFNWSAANDYCTNRDAGGFSDWRLPSLDEFMVMLGGCDAQVLAGNPGYCNGCAASATCTGLFGAGEGSHWTSTLYDATHAWYNVMQTGYMNDGNTITGSAHVICVRSVN